MSNRNVELILREDDHRLLLNYVKGGLDKSKFDPVNAAEMLTELNRARVVCKEDFPGNVVRINSKVKLKSDDSGEIMEIVLVTPEKADIKQRRISVMAPVGTAVLGFQEGEKVNWAVPSGERSFTIVKVFNRMEQELPLY